MAAVVKNLSSADQQLSYSDQKKISAAKKAYETAKAAGDKTAMEKAHADAETVRLYAGYSGGADGTGDTPIGKTSGKTVSHPSGNKGGNEINGLDTRALSETDKGILSPEDQQKIAKLKLVYGATTDQGQKDYINSLANAIRAGSGYTAGKTGAGYNVLPYGQGGKSAEQIDRELAAYEAAYTNYGSSNYWGPHTGYTNGYNAAMNSKSKANRINQQMFANEQAMTDENREVLHAENMRLADLLYKYTGQSAKTTYYNKEKGRWETWSGNLGYGYDLSHTQPNIRENVKKFYGYTDEEMEKWANDTSRYFNFVDTDVPARNTVDESSGYTGIYAQYVNGPYAVAAGRSAGVTEKNTDVIGDGFGDEGTFYSFPKYDENGNIIKTAPALKYNNDMSQYSAQFAPQAVNGLLVGKGAAVPLTSASDTNNTAGQMAYYENYGKNSPLRASSRASGTSGGTFDSYLQQIYAEALAAQLKALESGYQQNISQLDASQGQIDAAYTEQKRQTSGQAAQDAAAWREVANAYGLNSGAVGQASLAQRNQLQSDLNKLNAAQAAARTELQRQRLLLGQQYQLAIEEAIAENKSELAKSLYAEAVRAEEALQQQEQFYANLALQYGKSMMSFAKSAGSGLSRTQEYNIIEDAVRNGYITDAQAMALAEMFGFL